MLAKERRAEAEEHVCLTPWMLQVRQTRGARLETSAAKEASDGSQVHWQDAKELESEGKAIDALSVHYSGACTIFSSGVREI